jgi:NAD(P)-dependent dehydrogenase (short-subunit alcohol dehydrogenase family)
MRKVESKLRRNVVVLTEYNLQGKVAIVTGAGRGIGKGIALTLAEAGADIVAVARTVAEIDETAEEVRQIGQRYLPVPTDVTQADQVEDMVRTTIGEFGRVDILVNNAGTGIAKPLVPMPELQDRYKEVFPSFQMGTSEEEWHRVMDTNLTSIFLATKAVGPHMIKRRQGKVINITSVEGARARKYEASYNTSKAAIIMFTRCVALEWARYNINVNAIGPGYVRTRMTAPLHNDERIGRQLLEAIPLGRLCQLREIGLLAVYLASDASNYMTGQTLYLDGGYLA